MPHAPYDPTQPASPAWQPQAPAQARNTSQLLPLLGVALGLLGLIMGVAAWFRAAPSKETASPAYAEQQVADAKKAVCDAYEKGWRSLEIAGKRQIENSTDTFPVAINTRLAEVTVANYLLNALSANLATPQDLKYQIGELAQAYQNIALAQLADGTQADSELFGLAADKAIAKLETICP